ncbi:uncharacterized protein LOC117224434 [Megalopta genalis]|uniref:uncharacterized protein LOC117224434 n=1 Tax=Megalopta genalis TaxID=115081 RepID=UPI003FD49C7D
MEKTCTIDLGSECSIIRESLARQLNLTLKDTNKVLSGFNNSEVVPIGRSKINIFVDNIPFKVRVLVVADDQLSKEIIIGRDVLNKAGTRAITDSSGVTFTCGDYRREVLEVNMTSYEERRPIVETDICCDSSVGDKSRLLELLNEYRNCVALNYNELGRTSVTELKIELLDDEPVFHKPYRLSQADKEIVRNIVEELEMNGIIRPSTSPYASPVVLVKKKTGDTRMAIDYRALNRKTKLMKFPLPIIEDQIDQLFGKKVFTSLDLKSGFYQLPIHPDSIEKTAFVTPDGQWEFLRMPFGLVNAPSVFQAMIKRVVKELALVYIDDVLIASEGLEEAYEQLKAVLQALGTNNLTLNLAKCKFFQCKIDYLGREISEEGVRPGLYKIEAVSRAAEPRNVKEVRQFLGLAGYFRRFIRNFACKVAPLTKLLRKNVPWEWGTKESEVVKEVKRILVDRPVLAIYSPSLTTEVHTDASAIGLGAILFQKHGGENRVVAYFSRKTTVEEQRYHSYDLETLAVVVALKTFRVYLLGIKFTIVTDCSAVRATAAKKDIQPRVARWWIYMQDFTFDIVYRPGTKLAHVDYLSRNPVECCAIDITEAEWIKVAQLQDPSLEVVRKILESKDIQPETKQYFDKYILKKGVLFRKTERGNKWVVPSMSRFQVVRYCHDEQGHFAVDGTLEKVREHYWFKGMRRFVTKYVKACLNCLYYKNPGGKKPGLLHPIEKIAVPFHTVHLDHVGPFVRSQKRNTQVLTVIDGFTKFCILEPVRDTSSKNVLRVLSQVIAIFGVPSRVITDRGSAFTAKSFEAFCVEHGMKHVLNAVATPRANGQCERLNRTLLSSLAATCAGEAEDKWDDKVKQVQSAINCTTNRTTRKSPTQLLFGFKPRSLAGAKLLAEIQDTLDQLDLQEMRGAAKAATDADQERQKKRFDAKRYAPPKYAVGDVVMVAAKHGATGESRKLLPVAKGPFKVTAVLPNDRYEVLDLRDMRKSRNSRTVVAVDSMKPWVTFDATQ